MNKTKTIATSFGDRCNNCCIFCFNRNRKLYRNEAKTLSEVKREVISGAQSGAEILSLEGGEPTINAGIFEVVRLARNKGFSEVIIITNGRMFSYGKFVEEIIEAGVTKIIFSIHGDTPRLHDSLTRASGSFQQIRRGIDNVKKAGFINIGSFTTIIKQNYRRLPHVGRLLASFGVKDAVFNFVIPMGDAKNNFFEIVPRISYTTPFLQKALDVGKRYGYSWKVRYYPLCCLGDHRDASLRTSFVGIPQRKKVTQCYGCEFFDECDGLWEEYIKKRGHSELKPTGGRYRTFSEGVFMRLEKLKKKEPFEVARSLEGINTPEAWKLRISLKNKESKSVLMSLIGLDTKQAWQLRRELMAKAPYETIMSIQGLDTEEAWRLREELKDREPFAVARSLEGLNTQQAWRLREEFKKSQPWAVAESLRGLDTEDAWGLRNQLELIEPGEVVEGLEGIDSERAWRLREELKQKEPNHVARSLKGLIAKRAWGLRRELKGKEPFAVALSIKGIDTKQAWRLREELKDREPFAVARSLEGLASRQAWEMREELSGRHKNNPRLLTALLR